MAVPAAGTVSIRGPQRSDWSSSCAPPVLCFGPPEFWLEEQPVPKGGSMPPGTRAGGKQRTSWPHQTCHKLTSGAQDGLTSRIAPPGVVGERTTTAYSPQSTRSFPRLQDIGWHWVTDTTAGVVSLVLAVLVCCLLIRWWRKRKE